MRLIDADALKAKIKSKYDNDDAEFDKGYNIGLEASVDLIDSAPTLPNPCGNPCNFTRPTGKWIETAEEYYEAVNERGGGVDEHTPYFVDDIACPKCLAMFSTIDNETERFNCCPNCGARIEAENDSDN